jgi:hypothetical protein
MIGEKSKTLIIRQLGNNKSEISLIDGNILRTNSVDMQFDHMREHGIKYKETESVFIKLI